MRKKWEECVTYTEVSKPDFGEKKSLTMFNGGNGDLYVAIHDENTGIAGKAIRIERDGGASTRNPRLVQALTIAYDAIAENENTLETETTKLTYHKENNLEFLECSCFYKMPISKERTLAEREIFFCPKCGKKIINEDY